MSEVESLKQFVLDQLESVEGISTKRMFGGIGFFQEGKMFGMIGSELFRLKADDSNRYRFTERGIKAFMSNDKKKGLPYFTVPADILEDRDQFLIWCSESISIAHKKKG